MARFPLDAPIVVTGGGGFLGRRIVDRLTRAGYRSIVAPRSRDVNLTREVDVERLMTDVRPRLVIHAAGRVGGIWANSNYPGSAYYENLMMATLVMEHARRAGVEKVVNVSSVCAYPNITPVPFREENIWSGYPDASMAPYGLAKRMMAVQSEAYRREFGFNSIVLLMANLYGPGDNFDPRTSHVIPGLIGKFVEAKARGDAAVVAWGDGTPTREFLYVDDAADAIVLAAERYDASDPVNIGSSHELTIRELTEQIARAVGFTGAVEWDTSRPNGQPRRKLDVSKAEALFGFRSRTGLVEGLRATVDWYQANRAPVATR